MKVKGTIHECLGSFCSESSTSLRSLFLLESSKGEKQCEEFTVGQYFSNAHKSHLECFLKHRFGELLQTLLGDQAQPFAFLSEAVQVVLTARLYPYLGQDYGNQGSRKPRPGLVYWRGALQLLWVLVPDNFLIQILK